MSIDKTASSSDKTTLPSQETISLRNFSSLDVKMGGFIGKGGSAEVCKATIKGVEVAIKTFHHQSSKNLLEHVQFEARLMAICQPSSKVVRIYGIYQQPESIALVLEYCSKGSLYEVFSNSKEEFPWSMRWNIALEVGEGLSCLHRQKIIHRDLKSLNILLNDQYHAKIADLGLAKLQLKNDHGSSKTERRIVCTARWCAPEVLQGAEQDMASDVYSFGVVLGEIASRRLPFSKLSVETAIHKIKEGEREKLPADCPEAYEQIIKICLKPLNERPSIENIVSELRQEKSKRQFDLVPVEVNYEKGKSLYFKNYYKQALAYFEKVAQEGYPPVYFYLLHLYHGDLGIPANSQKQTVCANQLNLNILWLQCAAQKGMADAQNILAYCYAVGLGVDKNFDQSWKYYQLAANRGNVSAQVLLANYYYGCKDFIQAMGYYRLAADQGHVSAQNKLAWFCQYITSDFVQAVKYYQLAAAQGDVSAQMSLAWCYQFSVGIPKNLSQTLKYYRLAADQGNTDAQKKLEILLGEHPHLKYQVGQVPQTYFFSSSNMVTDTTITAATTGGVVNAPQNSSKQLN